VTPTAMFETKDPLDCLPTETGMRSKRNFHRPESNCGMALNSGWRVFIVLQSRLQLQIHQRQSKIATPINGLSTANQKEMFQSEFSGVELLFIPLFSSVRRPTFQKGLKFFLHPILPRLVREQDHATHETLELAERQPSFDWALHSHGLSSVGIIVALIVVGFWPERSPIAAKSADE
jgi:hypothetical protein